MTKLLDDAIQQVRELPDSEQDEAAVMLLAVVSRSGRSVQLDDDTRSAVREGQEQARRGDFVSDAEMTTFFRQHGVKSR